ncbi:hypothetical protein ACHQM5_024152 [Ranunculus cassubicifolius]
MSISAFIGTQLIPKPLSSSSSSYCPSLSTAAPKGGAAVIECSSRPQKKATAHHRKTRPKKTQPWDIKRKPCVYDPLPPLPSEWSFAEATEASEGQSPATENADQV